MTQFGYAYETVSFFIEMTQTFDEFFQAMVFFVFNNSLVNW